MLISDPPKRLAYSWDSCSPEAKHEGTSRVTFDLEPRGKVVKLTVTHDDLDEGGKTFRDISGGWPMVIASLKSLLESGRAADDRPCRRLRRKPPMPKPEFIYVTYIETTPEKLWQALTDRRFHRTLLVRHCG